MADQENQVDQNLLVLKKQQNLKKKLEELKPIVIQDPHPHQSSESSSIKSDKNLSAINKFKKYVLGPITEQAIVNADIFGISSIDKMKLLNKAYNIVWEKIILEPLYKQNNCETEEDKKNLRTHKDIQDVYNKQVRAIRKYKKKGELDDQEHFRDDLTAILTDAIRKASDELGIK